MHSSILVPSKCSSGPPCRENDDFKSFDEFLLALKQSKRKSVKQVGAAQHRACPKQPLQAVPSPLSATSPTHCL